MWKYQHFVAPPPPPMSLFTSAFLPEIMFCSRQCSGFYEQMHMINSKYKLLKGVSLSGKKSRLQVLSEIWKLTGNSLVVKWLGHWTLTAKNWGSIPGRRTKILQATQYGQKKKRVREKNRFFFLKKLPMGDELEGRDNWGINVKDDVL